MADYQYEKYDLETGKTESCPLDDKDGKITGKCILNLPKWFDENPEERMRLGWVKHITHNSKEILDYDPQTEFVVRTTRTVDAYTIEDELHVMKKSEELLALEELLSVASWGDGIVFY